MAGGHWNKGDRSMPGKYTPDTYSFGPGGPVAPKQDNSALKGLIASMTANTGGGNPAPYQPIQPSAPTANIPHIQPVDLLPAQRAAFARAKDQVGEAGQGALAGLRSSLAGRGMLGSGGEFRGTANVANKGLGELGDVSREQAINEVGVRTDEAKTNYGGDLTQRGQDINHQEAADALSVQQQQFGARLAHEQAQAGAAKQQSAIQGLLAALSGKATARY
jgi:hypothetical protein